MTQRNLRPLISLLYRAPIPTELIPGSSAGDLAMVCGTKHYLPAITPATPGVDHGRLTVCALRAAAWADAVDRKRGKR